MDGWQNGWMAEWMDGSGFKCELVYLLFWTLILASTQSCRELETLGLPHLFLSFTVPVSHDELVLVLHENWFWSSMRTGPGPP